MIWRKGTISRDWRKNIIVPLYKRGEKKEEITEVYRYYVRIRYMQRYLGINWRRWWKKRD